MTRIDRTISFEIPDYWTPEHEVAPGFGTMG
jgi:hypothetical protein